MFFKNIGHYKVRVCIITSIVLLKDIGPVGPGFKARGRLGEILCRNCLTSPYIKLRELFVSIDTILSIYWKQLTTPYLTF